MSTLVEKTKQNKNNLIWSYGFMGGGGGGGGGGGHGGSICMGMETDLGLPSLHI